MKTPSGYSAKKAKAILNRYKGVETTSKGDKPIVIGIMSESLCDFRVYENNFRPNQEVMPYWDSLHENVVKGYLASSVYGGGTADSEWEFLTGNSLSLFPTGTIVYQQHMRKPTQSLSRVLRSQGYFTMATHPFAPSGWNRTKAWPLLGFQKTTFEEDYTSPNLKKYRGFISDKSMYEYIIDQYEKRDQSKNWFLFGVTMQNHGGYLVPIKNKNVRLDGYATSYPSAEEYLTMVKHSDDALKTLIDYFKKQDKKVVLVIFGDHQPGVEQEFLEEMHGKSFDTLEEQELKQQVPFLIWANYPIESQEGVHSSINYLSNLVADVAGFEKTPYQNFLEEMRQCIPAINSMGYFSVADNRWKSFGEKGTKEEEKWLKEYKILEYYDVFGK